MFFWRRVAPQAPEEGLEPTATPGFARNVRELNDLISRGKSFSGFERNPLFLNRGGRGFTDVAGLLGVDFDDDARAVAAVDWDHDGDLDLWVTNRTAPRVRLLENRLPSRSRPSSVAVRLVGNGTTTNRDGVGARLTLTGAPEPGGIQIRTVRAGDGFLAQSSSWVHFGLGAAADTPERELSLSVRWPGGGTETFTGLRAGARHTLVQGRGSPGDPDPVATRDPDGIPESAPESAPESPTESGPDGFFVANRVPLPGLAFADESGSARSTAEFAGAPLLVNLWATWCAPCLEELRMLAEHAEDWRALGATVLPLNVDGLAIDGENPSPAGDPAEVLAKVGAGLPLAFAGQETLAKIEVVLEFLTARRDGLPIPTSLLVDAGGDVAAVYLGPVDRGRLATDLALLDAPPAEQLERTTPRPGRWLADPRRIDRTAHLNRFATLLATNGFPEESRRLYAMVSSAEDGTASARELYNQGKAAADEGRTDEAARLYREAIDRDPEYGPALTGLGALLLMQRRLDEARPLFERALEIDPNHATALVNLAMIDQARGDVDGAEDRLRKVIALNPEFAEAHLNLGSLLASGGRHAEAIGHLEKAVDLKPGLAAARVNLGVAYSATGRLEEAEAQFRSVIASTPRMAFAQYGLGSVLARREDHAGAAAAFRQAIELGARNARTLTGLGISLLALGEREAAIEALRAALALDPDHDDARRALAEAEATSDAGS